MAKAYTSEVRIYDWEGVTNQKNSTGRALCGGEITAVALAEGVE